MTLPSLKQQPNALAPIPAAKRVYDALIGMANGLEGRGIAGEVISARHAPSGEQRTWMQARVAELDASLAPADERSRRAELASLFAVLAIEAGDDRQAAAVSSIYLADLADIPLFALRAACQAYRQGAAGSGKWVPKIAELRAYAARVAQPWRDERAKIDRILQAHILSPPPDQSARQKNMERAAETQRILAEAGQKIDARDLKTHLKARPNPAEDEGPHKSEVDLRAEWIAREQANPRCPDPSPALRAILGLPEMQRQEDAA